MTFHCAHCGKRASRDNGAVNRARKIGAPLYCNKGCAGLARRRVDTRTDTQRRADKAAYDRVYRAKNLRMLKRKKAAYYQASRDPEKERKKRQARMSWHVEYCRKYYSDPKRKRAKVRYDERRRSLKIMGTREWAECHRLLVRLEKAIRRTPWYERAKERGYYDRTAQQRKRDAQISRH